MAVVTCILHASVGQWNDGKCLYLSFWGLTRFTSLLFGSRLGFTITVRWPGCFLQRTWVRACDHFFGRFCLRPLLPRRCERTRGGGRREQNCAGGGVILRFLTNSYENMVFCFFLKAGVRIPFETLACVPETCQKRV